MAGVEVTFVRLLGSPFMRYDCRLWCKLDAPRVWEIVGNTAFIDGCF